MGLLLSAIAAGLVHHHHVAWSYPPQRGWPTGLLMSHNAAATGVTAARPGWRVSRPLLLILITVFLNIMGLGLILPVLPFYATAYGADGAQVGLLFTAFSGMQFLASPVFGALSDRLGRRPIILLGLLGQALAYVMMGAANSLSVLFISRIVSGVTAGNISATQAYVADVTPWQERTRAYGLVGAAFGAGLLFGPALGGVLTIVDHRAPAFGAAALVGLNLLFGYFMLRESLPVERRVRKPIAGQLNPFGVLVPLLGRSALRGPLIATFLLNVALSAFQANFAVFAGARFGLGPTEVAGLFVATGFANIVAQLIVLPRLSLWLADSALVLAGSVINVFGDLATAFAPSPALYWGTLPAITGGYSLSRGPLTSMVTKLVAPTEQGLVNGGIQSTISLAGVVGPIAAGFLFEYVGTSAPYWGSALAVGVAAVAIALRSRQAPVPATVRVPTTDVVAASGSTAVRNGHADASRTILHGTLDGVGLLPVVHLINEAHKSGSLRLGYLGWTGEVSFQDGQPISAFFGPEIGPPALDALIVLSNASFAFDEGRPSLPGNLALDADEVQSRVAVGTGGSDSNSNRARFIAAVYSPVAVPRLVDDVGDRDPTTEVVLMRSTLQTLVSINGILTVGEISNRRGFARTCRDLGELLKEGLVAIEPHSTADYTLPGPSAASPVPAGTEGPR
jgi:DHA1 family tetracycline resistance protein-like MFS transporter